MGSWEWGVGSWGVVVCNSQLPIPNSSLPTPGSTLHTRRYCIMIFLSGISIESGIGDVILIVLKVGERKDSAFNEIEKIKYRENRRTQSFFFNTEKKGEDTESTEFFL